MLGIIPHHKRVRHIRSDSVRQYGYMRSSYTRIVGHYRAVDLFGGGDRNCLDSGVFRRVGCRVKIEGIRWVWCRVRWRVSVRVVGLGGIGCMSRVSFWVDGDRLGAGVVLVDRGREYEGMVRV